MNKCYIALGGIASRLLSNFSRDKGEACNRYIYMDADFSLGDAPLGQMAEKYVLTKQMHGCHARIIGKDEVKSMIYGGEMPTFFDDFYLSESLEMIFLTSTFGGFGSAAVSEVSDYYGINLKRFRYANGVQKDFGLRIIAFSLEVLSDFYHFENLPLKNVWGENEIAFINEMREKELRNNPWYQTRVNGFPVSHFYVPAISADRLVSAIGFSDADLQSVDSKEKYYHSWQPKKKHSDIFISYSSKNRAIADMLVEIAEKEGISCWIDTKSIGPGSYAKQIVEGIREASVFVAIVSKDAIISPHVKNELNIATSRISAGLVLMPFQIDDADLDDECSYYLGRHEFFNGKTPPIQEKIKQFVEKIKILLNGQD